MARSDSAAARISGAPTPDGEREQLLAASGDGAPTSSPRSRSVVKLQRSGWTFELLFGVRGFKVYTEYPYRLYVVVGPWAISFGPWSRTSRYGNGSRWHSGWHRWREVELDV